MKKVIVVLLLLAMIAGGLFAQDAPALTLSGKVDTYFVPFQYIDRDGVDSLMATGMGRDVGDGTGLRSRFFIEGKTDVVGLKIQLQFYPNPGTGNPIRFDDNVMVWWKPFPQLELDAGKYVNDTFRGKIGDNWLRKYGVGCYNNDAIFSRFHSSGIDIGGSGDLGFLALFNFGDFKAGINLPRLKPFTTSINTLSGNGIGGGGAGQNQDYEAVDFDNGDGEFGRVWQRIQIAAGYNIQDIGFFRAQFVGANPSISGLTKTNAGTISFITDPNDFAGVRVTGPRIEAAFQLTAVQGLTLDFGGKFVLPVNESQVKVWDLVANPVTGDPEWVKGALAAGTYKAPVQIGLGANYVLDALTIGGRVDTNFGGGADIDEAVAGANDGISTTLKQGFELNIHLWPTYNLGFMTLGLDVGFAMRGDTTRETLGVKTTTVNGNQFGGGIYAQKVIGACTIRGGLAFSASTKVGEAGTKDVKSDTIFSIPVTFDYTF